MSREKYGTPFWKSLQLFDLAIPVDGVLGSGLRRNNEVCGRPALVNGRV